MNADDRESTYFLDPDNEADWDLPGEMGIRGGRCESRR